MPSVSTNQIPKSFRAYRPKALQWLGRTVLSFLGWKVNGAISDEHAGQKLVVIVAPHTSNWDFPLMLLTSYKTNVPLKWMGKKNSIKS